MNIRRLPDAAFAQLVLPRGEAAQDAWHRAETEELHRQAYRSGEMGFEEAYDLSIIDELGRERTE